MTDPITYDYEIKTEKLLFRIARTAEEIEEVKRFRYNVFYREKGARANSEMESKQQDFDQYDDYALHVLVEDQSKTFPESLVGTHRLLVKKFMPESAKFYTEQFYDCSNVLSGHKNILEIGRVCVAAEYRTGKVLSLMWKYTMALIRELDITLMFGCASFAGDSVNDHAHSLSYMYHKHLAPKEKQPQILVDDKTSINIIPEDEIDASLALKGIPTLIKGYLKLNGKVSQDAVIDHQFNTVFTLLYLDIGEIAEHVPLNRITK